MSDIPFSTLLGKTLTAVKVEVDQITFTTDAGATYVLFHAQDCCETVAVEDVTGDVDDLLNSPILVADESSNSDNPKPDAESHTWTFYKLATAKGWVDIRWYGHSNGYYSERVSFAEVKPRHHGRVSNV